MEWKKFFSREASVSAVVTLALGVGGGYIAWGGATIERAGGYYLGVRCTEQGKVMAEEAFHGPVTDAKGNMLMVVCHDHPAKEAILALMKKGDEDE